MQHYQLGQKIGEFTITSYNYDTNYYTLQCSCGNTSDGDSTHVTRKISNLMSEGFTSCMQCSSKMRTDLNLRAEKNSTVYTYKDVYREYVKKSKERNIEFKISLEEASSLFSQPCYYCGNEPQNCRIRNTGMKVYYQGIDRVDNTLGYETDNIVPCCKYCNSFKSDRSQEDFLMHVEKVYLRKVQRSEQPLVGSSEPKWESSIDNGRRYDLLFGETQSSVRVVN